MCIMRTEDVFRAMQILRVHQLGDVRFARAGTIWCQCILETDQQECLRQNGIDLA